MARGERVVRREEGRVQGMAGVEGRRHGARGSMEGLQRFLARAVAVCLPGGCSLALDTRLPGCALLALQAPTPT